MNNQTETTESKNAVDFCSTSFEVSGQQVINNYKCNSKKMSVPDVWKIEKRKREFSRRSSIFVLN